ncbi:MAG TPA: hypothetical protein VGG19_14630 [Tepidisphaeraceae bacterium]
MGSGDTLLAYVKNSNLVGVILDASGNAAVSEFTIDPSSDDPNAYGALTAVEDNNGNAVIAFSTTLANFKTRARQFDGPGGSSAEHSAEHHGGKFPECGIFILPYHQLPVVIEYIPD